MVTARTLSFTTLIAMAMGAGSVSLAEEVKDSSTSTEIVSAKDSDLRNEDALRVAVGDFDDVEFLLSAEGMEAIEDNVYISFNGVSAKGGEGSGSSISSAEASGQVETTENSSTTFSGALTLASATSETVTTSVSSVAMSMSSDDSTEQYATVDAGKSYYEQVSTSNSGSAVTTYSATSFLGNSNSVGDGDGSYGISTLDSGVITPTPTATDRKWVGGSTLVGSTSYNWSNGSNWDSTGWNNGDNATFDSEGSAYSTVTVDTDIIANNLTVSGSTDYTFEYSTGASLTVTGTAIISSEVYTSSLTITGGTTTFEGEYTYVGDLGGNGTITILGSDTVVTFETGLILGFGFGGNLENTSEGELIIGSLDDTGNGPYVTFGTDTSSDTTEVHVGGGPNNTGKITINSGTTIFDTAVYLAYGYGSTGTITIEGGETTFNGYTCVGCEEGSTGTITINGGTTTFEGEVDVGFYGEGTITIEGGTNTFSGGDLWIGCYATGEMTITDGKNTFSGYTYVGYAGDGYVTISGGENTFSGYTYVGYEDKGTLTITGGENTFSGYTYVGYEDKGTLTITGGETTFSGKYTEVGYKGTGEMTISGDDTVVRFDGSQVYVGDGVNSIGTITINGGTTTFGEKVHLGNSSNSSGTLTINGGTTTFKKEVSIGSTNQSSSPGTLTITSGTTVFEGAINIGQGGSTSTMTITGGTTTIKGATTIGSNSSLSVSGGTLTIEKKIGTDATGSVTFSASGKLIVTQTLLATAGELEEGQTAAVAVITANTITFGGTTLDYLDSSDSGYVNELVSSYITVQSGKYRVIDWYYYADTGTLYAIVILPEPSMFGLFFGLGAIGLVATRRRRRKA